MITHGWKKHNLPTQKAIHLEPHPWRKRFVGGTLVLTAVAALCALGSVFTDSPHLLLATGAMSGLLGYLFLKGWKKYSGAVRNKSLKDIAYSLYDRTLLPLRFDEKYYLRAYPHVADKIASGRYRSAIEHYRIAGRKQSFSYAGRGGKFWRLAKELACLLYDRTLLSLWFDEKYYLRAYPHVVDKIASGRYRSAIEHYRIAGRRQSFSCAGPGGKFWRLTKELACLLWRLTKELACLLYDRTWVSLGFDEKYYLRAYPHVATKIASGRYRSAIEHYRIAGRKQSFSKSGSGPVGRRCCVNNVPVALFVFNRPALTRAVFNEIRRFAPTTLLVVADGPRDESEKHLCEEARAIVREIDWPCRLLKNFSSQNLGCKNRMASGLQWVFEQVEEAIILEDDCLPDPTFFSFCSHLLVCYRDDPRVMHISGSCFLMQPCTDKSYWFSRHSDIWGWATWRRAFRHYDVSMSSWPVSSRLRRLLIWRNPIERNYWTRRFDDAHAGRIDTWDYQWHWNVYERNGRVIVPRTNLITNLGFGAFATHTHDPNVPAANLATRSLHGITHPLRFQRQPQADFEMFHTRYYLEGHLARREGSIPAFQGPIDLIVTHDVPVFAHGVGALIQKVFGRSRSWANIRSEDYHIQHKSTVPSLLIKCNSSERPNRLTTMCAVAKALGESRVRTVLAVPYSDQDCLNALAVSYLYSSPLYLWLMDDQNIYGTRISDSLMRELIERSVLRLAICEEMKLLYDKKVGRPFEIQTPVEMECDIVHRALPATLRDPPQIVSCGNVWCETTMRSLMAFTKTAGISVDWYGNLGNKIAHEELSASGIRVRGSIAHHDLIATLRTYDLAIVAMPDHSLLDRAWQARLSFPSKIVTLSAAANLPILFVGPEDNPGATFVRKNHIGEACGWTRDHFSAALDRMLTIKRLAQMRNNAAAMSGQFSSLFDVSSG
jgi:hypothetical protein